MLNRIKPKDIVAVLFVIIWAVMKYYNIESPVDEAAPLLGGLYFGHRVSGKDIGS